MQLDEAIAILEQTPGTLRSMLGGLPETWTAFAPASGSWSAFDITGHLLHGEKTDWMTRTRVILEHGTSRPFDSFKREAMFESSRGRSLDDVLGEFTVTRRKNLDELTIVAPSDLDREGMHPALGTVTLSQLIAAWVVHDVAHIAQISEAIAKRYRDDIGPWRAYLPIVDRPDVVGD